jgi:antirestriction protein ArdC
LSRVRGQLACTVLRGAEGREVLRLPDIEKKAAVKKGSKGTIVVFTKRIPRGDDDEHATISMLKTYHVFNVEQIEGLPETPHPISTIAPIEVAERFIAATKADIRIGGSKACYVPSLDFVAMPPKEAFAEASSFYATNLHELGHNAAIRIMPRLLGQARLAV